MSEVDTPSDPAATTPHESSVREPAGSDWPGVPGYEITGEIARGGMGVVYAARDITFGREVAVKTTLPHLSADPRLAAQFDREARLTALLQHPGVPPVHALGTLADGRPFLAMKLIKGRTLADELAATDRVADRPRMLGVFEHVCQAVGYAHSQGIIHRDLKPGNVMVGAFGEVQVMDWGLAKVLASRGRGGPEEATPVAHAPGPEGDETQAGHAKGTPAYMPPEQARGEWDEVDARADVFALGGILCAILTGKPPHTGRTGAEVLRRAAGGDLSEAFARLDVCGADPELISLCEWCLAPQPTDRPADARTVAGAVAAYRAGVEERARKAEADRAAAEAKAEEQRKRRRVQLALATAVALFLLAGSGFAWWQDRQATARQVEESARLARNSEALGALAERYEDTLRRGDADTAELVLGQIEQRIADGGDELSARSARYRTDLALLRAFDSIDTILWDGDQDHYLNPNDLAARWRSAFAAAGLDPEGAPPAEFARSLNESVIRERALSVLDKWLITTPTPRLREALLAADTNPFRDRVRDAVVARDRSRLAELIAAPEAVEQPHGFIASLGLHSDIPADLRRTLLAAAIRTTPGNSLLLMSMGSSYNDTRNPRRRAAESVRWHQAALAVNPRGVGALNNLGNSLADLGRYAEAVACYREAIRISPGYAVPYSNLGVALSKQDKWDEALAALDQAIRIDPKSVSAYLNRASALNRLGKYGDAIAAMKRAIELEPEYAAAHNGLGVVLWRTGNLEGALAAHDRAIGLKPDEPRFHTSRGHTLSGSRRFDDALAAYQEAIRLDPEYAEAYAGLALMLRSRGQLDRAIELYRKAVEHDPTNAENRSNLGEALRVRGDHREALAAAWEATRLEPEYAPGHLNLGAILGYLGDRAQPFTLFSTAARSAAVAALRTAVLLDPGRASAHVNLVSHYVREQRFADALPYARAAVRLDPESAQSQNQLGMLLLRRGDIPGARAALGKAARLDPQQFGAATIWLPPLPVAPPPRLVKP